MSQDILSFVPAACELLALGEPTHREPAFGWLRNELFTRLVDHGFRSIALETDRAAALVVDDFVQEGVNTLDTAMADGFTHGFGQLAANRALITWMREYNQAHPSDQRLAFYGFDAATENTSAPSPRAYLMAARDYLRLDLDFDHLLGDDEQWSRQEAVLDPAKSIGATAEADQLRALADDMLVTLYGQAPGLMATTSRREWHKAEAHLTTALGLLRYHKQAAADLPRETRISRLSATRDALMARNLLDIRRTEAHRGATLVFAHNLHLQRAETRMRVADMDLRWFPAGTIVASLLGESYAFIAGSLGISAALALSEPAPDTYEGALQHQMTDWGLTTTAPTGRTRTDTDPRRGYFPLDRSTLDGADAFLHIKDGAADS